MRVHKFGRCQVVNDLLFAPLDVCNCSGNYFINIRNCLEMAEEIVKTLNDFEMVAKRKICHENRWLWNYISAGDEKTRSEMRAAFQK